MLPPFRAELGDQGSPRGNEIHKFRRSNAVRWKQRTLDSPPIEARFNLPPKPRLSPFRRGDLCVHPEFSGV
jgi:hypothetical protein